MFYKIIINRVLLQLSIQILFNIFSNSNFNFTS